MSKQILWHFLCVLQIFGLGSCSDWAYIGPNGPDHWCELSMDGNQCCGSRQSPINIDTSSAMYVNIELELNGLNRDWSYVNLTNDHHTVLLNVPSDSSNCPSAVVRAGHRTISSIYVLHSLHFHFGSDDSVGSEHQFNGKSSPMEMHTVFYNSKYPSIVEAKIHQDGLLVVGTLYYISNFDNSNYDSLTRNLKNVAYVDQKFTIRPGFAIGELLPSDLSSAYSYDGSLTTPTCNEAVQWFVLKTQVPISERQMEMFREVTSIHQHEHQLHFDNEIQSEGEDVIHMSNNYRPVQPLNKRFVWRVNSRKGIN